MNELTSLHGTLDRLFSDMFGEGPWGATAGDRDRGGALTYRLPVDIVETEQGYRIQAPVPGFRPQDVEVTYSDGVLSIRARRSEEQTRREGNYVRRELAMGDYQRQIMLPRDLQADNIKATFDNGMLTIEVPGAPKARPARIEIQHAPDREAEPAGRAPGRSSRG